MSHTYNSAQQELKINLAYAAELFIEHDDYDVEEASLTAGVTAEQLIKYLIKLGEY